MALKAKKKNKPVSKQNFNLASAKVFYLFHVSFNLTPDLKQ